MKKQKTYPHFNLSVDGMRKISESFLSNAQSRHVTHIWEVSTGDAMWTFDTIEEFIADYKPEGLFQYIATINATPGGANEQLIITRKSTSLPLSVSAELGTRDKIQRIFNIVEQSLLRIESSPKAKNPAIRVFVGHGRSSGWRDLKDHLQDQHGYQVEAYESGARAGHSIRDILEEMLTASSIAFLVLTAEDETGDGHIRARQNVVHETGLFQGRLGFSKAVVLIEDGTEEFSNLAGIQQIRYSRDNIRETFGDVLAIIRREFGPASTETKPPFTTGAAAS
jgi:predicted nucleotide-binding protein